MKPWCQQLRKLGKFGTCQWFPTEPATDHDIYESLWLRTKGQRYCATTVQNCWESRRDSRPFFCIPKSVWMNHRWYMLVGYQCLVLSVTIKIQGWYYAFLILHMWKHSWHTENDMRERMIEAFCLPIPVGLWLPLPPSQGLLWFWNGQGFMIWDEICRIW